MGYEGHRKLSSYYLERKDWQRNVGGEPGLKPDLGYVVNSAMC